jgi:hypothetical protein
MQALSPFLQELKWARLFVPAAVTVVVLLGAQVIWPRDRLESLAAQQHRVDLRIDSTGFRIDSLKLNQASYNLEIGSKLEDMQRRLATLTILACSGQKPSSVTYRLAGCESVLNP